MEPKTIEIKCKAADLLPIDRLKEFQGNLKKITRKNLDKLKQSILTKGFIAPFFVWPEYDNYLLDGHQRLKALIELRQEGYDIPLLPVCYIDAETEQEARGKLLYITSQYGEFDPSEISDFLQSLENGFDFANVRLVDGVAWSYIRDTEEGGNKTKEINTDKMIMGCKCPRCGMEFDP